MPKIVFVNADDTSVEVEAAEGVSVMRAAVTNDVRGIVGECGGNMICATCHVYVDPAFVDLVGPASEDEADMLEDAVCPPNERSRLSCQIKVRAELDGLILHLPETQV